MKSRIIPSSLNLSEDKLINAVKVKFAQYLKFIGCKYIDFPEKILLKFYNGLADKKPFIGQLHIPNSDNEKCILTLDQIDCITNKNDVIFHEFTHIFDYLIVNKNIPFDKRVSTLHYISEIRATYIEYCVRCNIKKLDNDILLPSTTTVFSSIKFKQIQICDEVIYYQDALIERIKKPNVRDATDYNDMLVKLAYYMGFSLFIQKHTHIKINSDDIIRLLSVRLGDSVERYFALKDLIPLDFLPISEDILHLAKDTETVMKNHYIDKFITK